MPRNTAPNQLPFSFSGKVVLGQKVGRKIGFPTANLNRVPSEATLKPGVYAGFCTIRQGEKVRNKNLKCLVYFGPRYIFGEKSNSFEVYIYHYQQSIYDYNLEVKVVKFIRPPQKITNLTTLKNQLEKDKQQGLKILQV